MTRHTQLSTASGTESNSGVHHRHLLAGAHFAVGCHNLGQIRDLRTCTVFIVLRIFRLQRAYCDAPVLTGRPHPSLGQVAAINASATPATPAHHLPPIFHQRFANHHRHALTRAGVTTCGNADAAKRAGGPCGSAQRVSATGHFLPPLTTRSAASHGKLAN